MNNLKKLLKVVFSHWGLLVSGLVLLVLFTAFSGLNITMVKPLLDYVFVVEKTNVDITTSGQLWQQTSTFLHQQLQPYGLYDILTGNFDYHQLQSGLNKIMTRTDSYLLLYLICVGAFLLILFKNIFYFGYRLILVNLRGRTILKMRDMLFHKYLNQSLAFFTHNRVGDSMVRLINDVSIVSDRLIGAFFDSIRDVFSVLVFTGIAFALNPRLFIYSATVLPVFTWAVGLLGKKIKKYSKRIQQQFSHLFSHVEEVLNNMRIVKAFAREDYEYNRLQKINHTFFKWWRKSMIYGQLNVPISELNSAVAGVVILVLGGREVLSGNGAFSFGDFMVFMLMMFSVLHPLKNISKAYADIRKALVSLDRVYEILDLPVQVVEKPNALEVNEFKNEIRFDKVSFAYDGGEAVLRDIDLTVKRGETLALVGSSGSGKSTMLNLVSRMYDPSAGKITIDGQDLRDMTLSSLRGLFGTVTQESLLFSETIAANINYGSKTPLTLEQLEQVAQTAHAHEFISDLPNTYDEMLHAKGANLSGGQRQRLCIARALAGDPPILLFDEATSALDTESERKVQEAIEHAAATHTVIVIAHRLSTVLNSTRIAVMNQGKIVGLGPHEELLKTCPRYQHLYNIQFSNG